MNMKWQITHNINFRKDILNACTKTTPDSPLGVIKNAMQSNVKDAREFAVKVGKDRMEYLKQSLWGGDVVPEPGEGFPVWPGYPGTPPGTISLSDAYKNVIKGPKYTGKGRWEINIGDADYLDKETRFGGNDPVLANLGIWRFFEYGRRIFKQGGKKGTEWWFIYSPGKGKFGQGYLIQRTEAPSGKGKRKQVPANQAAVIRKPALRAIYFKLNWRLQKQIEKGFKGVKLGRPGYAFRGRFKPSPGMFFGMEGSEAGTEE